MSTNVKKGKVPIRGITLVFFVIIVVICAIIGYNHYLQSQLSHLRRETATLNDRLKQFELKRIEDISVKQLAEKLDFVMSQQEVNVATTQEMIDYMTFTFTLIGVFFLLVSGYFVYRQQKSEQREDEGWVLAKGLLELVTQSQQFVVQVQNELQRQQDLQKEKQEITKKYLKDTVTFLNNRANVLVTQFARDTISKGIHFARLVDISNRIDNTRFQLQAFDFSFDPNCYFLKAVYEYIIGNYNTAKDEFDSLILERRDKVLNEPQKKQLSLCYYYRSLIEYNIQGNLGQAEDFVKLAVEKDPQINGPDFKSMLLKAEIKFKRQTPETFNEYKAITKRLTDLGILNDTQRRLLSYAYLGMAYSKLLDGGKKFLPSYYGVISQIDDTQISEIVQWLNMSMDSHFYTLLTLGQLAVVFESVNRNVGLETSHNYFAKTYDVLEKVSPFEVKEETRSRILAYAVKLICEKFLGKPSLENTKLVLKDLLNDQELKSVYSIFSKVNVSKTEFIEELDDLQISMA